MESEFVFNFAKLKRLAASCTVVALRVVATEPPRLMGLVFAGPKDKVACRPFGSVCMLQASTARTDMKFDDVARKLGMKRPPLSETIVAFLRDKRGGGRVIVAVKDDRSTDGNATVFSQVRVTMATETSWKRALSSPMTVTERSLAFNRVAFFDPMSRGASKVFRHVMFADRLRPADLEQRIHGGLRLRLPIPASFFRKHNDFTLRKFLEEDYRPIELAAQLISVETNRSSSCKVVIQVIEFLSRRYKHDNLIITDKSVVKIEFKKDVKWHPRDVTAEGWERRDAITGTLRVRGVETSNTSPLYVAMAKVVAERKRLVASVLLSFRGGILHMILCVFDGETGNVTMYDPTGFQESQVAAEILLDLFSTFFHRRSLAAPPRVLQIPRPFSRIHQPHTTLCATWVAFMIACICVNPGVSLGTLFSWLAVRAEVNLLWFLAWLSTDFQFRRDCVVKSDTLVRKHETIQNAARSPRVNRFLLGKEGRLLPYISKVFSAILPPRATGRYTNRPRPVADTPAGQSWVAWIVTLVAAVKSAEMLVLDDITIHISDEHDISIGTYSRNDQLMSTLQEVKEFIVGETANWLVIEDGEQTDGPDASELWLTEDEEDADFLIKFGFEDTDSEKRALQIVMEKIVDAKPALQEKVMLGIEDIDGLNILTPISHDEWVADARNAVSAYSRTGVKVVVEPVRPEILRVAFHPQPKTRPNIVTLQGRDGSAVVSSASELVSKLPHSAPTTVYFGANEVVFTSLKSFASTIPWGALTAPTTRIKCSHTCVKINVNSTLWMTPTLFLLKAKTTAVENRLSYSYVILYRAQPYFFLAAARFARNAATCASRLRVALRSVVSHPCTVSR